jgi:hypothetical protein
LFTPLVAEALVFGRSGPGVSSLSNPVFFKGTRDAVSTVRANGGLMPNDRAIAHDGQGDAMPCQCPACKLASRRVAPLPPRLVLISNPAGAAPRDVVAEARAC